VLREFVYVQDTAPKNVADLAEQATDAILAIKTLVDAAADTGLDVDPGALAHRKKLLKSALVLGKTATSGRAMKLERKYHALFTRVINRWDDYLRYTHDPKIDFDNYADGRVMPMSNPGMGICPGQQGWNGLGVRHNHARRMGYRAPACRDPGGCGSRETTTRRNAHAWMTLPANPFPSPSS
jgi:hypothetical protein